MPHRTTIRAIRCAAVSVCASAVAACDGPQSALDPAGVASERLADLFIVLSVGAAAIWLVTVGLALYAVYARRKPAIGASGAWLIIGGGVAAPIIILTATLVHGLALLPPLLPVESNGRLQIEVIGEQWWWRVRYRVAAGAPIEIANEIHLPAGEAVELALTSDNVIHSFWIPPLAGKVDMIPGRRTRLVLEATRPGEYRGVCAEYCGASHALMALRAVVHEPRAFDAWLEAQRAPAARPVAALVAAGAAAFLRNGCGACHTVRGTAADGGIGPDLTHVGSRLSLGAGILPNDAASFRHWVSLTDELKPSAQMPAFGMLPSAEIQALGAYLEALQ